MTATALVVLLAVPVGARAQLDGLATDYSLERFRLATDGAGILDVEAADVIRHLDLELAAFLDYADDLLNVYRDGPVERQRIGTLVSHRLGANLIAAVGLFDRAQIGLDVPLVFSQDQDIGNLMGGPDSVSSSGLGDLRCVPKLSLMKHEERGLDIALVAGFTLPTGSDDDYISEPAVTFAPEILISKPFSPRVRAGLNVGYRTRPKRTALDLEVNDELYAHAGVGYMVAPSVELDATFSVASAADDVFGESNRTHSELRGGVGVHLAGFILFAAAGSGVSQGFGTPDWRLVAGARFARSGASTARAATAISARDEVAKNEPPAQPAAPQTDADGDGVLDSHDLCTFDAEDVDGFEDADGCPDPDNDGDRVVDSVDECPDVPGSTRAGGCPQDDRDDDGVGDRVDNCPDEKGAVANRGCVAAQLVVLTESGLEILQNIRFASDQARISPSSYPVLRNVAEVLERHPRIGAVRIEGHTDDRGSAEYNRSLSARRAEAVLDFLVAHGIDRLRLSAAGLGESQPVESNATSGGRLANRRVEFRLDADAP